MPGDGDSEGKWGPTVDAFICQAKELSSFETTGSPWKFFRGVTWSDPLLPSAWSQRDHRGKRLEAESRWEAEQTVSYV